MAAKTQTETTRHISIKDDVVTVTEITVVTKTEPGKEPQVKETRKVKEYKGPEGFKKLPEDIRNKLQLTKEQEDQIQRITSQPVSKNFIQDCLKEHNNYRQRHGVGPLKLSKLLVDMSENEANQLAKKDKVQLREDANYGENVSWIGSSDPNHVINAAELMSQWYSQEANYNFTEEPKDMNAGHFTQMVWKATKEFGIGAAKSDTNKIYVVAFYSPPGNYRGEFLQNVFPPGTVPGKSTSTKKESRSMPNKISDKPPAFDDLNNESVEVHNSYRARHGVPPLVYSNEVALYAQEWADRLAKHDIFEHRKSMKYGENIYNYKSSDPNSFASAADACKSWYSEIEKYKFNKEPTSTEAGHFTQMVWKDTKEVGMGRATAKSGRQFIVANYNPPGNYVGRYRENVLPPKK